MRCAVMVVKKILFDTENLKSMRKFLEFVGAAVYGYVASWILWLIIWWFSPIVMSIGWSWWLLLYVICYFSIVHITYKINGVLFVPYALFLKSSKWSLALPVLFYLVNGFKALLEPYNNGVDSFGFIQWVLALSVSFLAYQMFASFVVMALMVLFHKE